MFFISTFISSCYILAIILALLSNVSIATGLSSSHALHDGDALINLSLEELMGIEVTTASRRSQNILEVSSAAFVITQDDIRRSGVTSIPDALRMAPGVQVARIGTDKWAVSIRGFNGRFANKLQVLMDGRSIYNPLFSGVKWEQHDTLLQDIERIEVIRGPSAAVWGANAVNGVINIITRKAAETQGLLITAGGGSFEQGFLAARYGGKLNNKTSYRVYAKGFRRDSMKSVAGNSAKDTWHNARGGFRLEHAHDIDHFTLQGDFFYNAQGDQLNVSQLGTTHIPPSHFRGDTKGGNIRFRWDRKFSDDSAVMLQMYYDRADYKVLAVTDYRIESFDIDLNHNFLLFDRHHITWGANYRLYDNKINDSHLLSYRPRQRTNHLASGYLRDEITLIPEELHFILGVRIDHNDFSGLEVQPNARLMWTPNQQNSVWGSVSRAVRTPSRAENDLRLTTQIPRSTNTHFFPKIGQITGVSSFRSEKLLAYELGYRHQFAKQASIDIAAFYNDYTQLRDLMVGESTPQSRDATPAILPFIINNNAKAHTYGVELSADWRVHNQWRLQGNYSYLRMHISSNPVFRLLDPTTGSANKVNPQHQVSIRSNYDISDRIQLNVWLRYVSKVSLYNIPSYVTMDTKLAFKPAKYIELFVVGQNLLSQNHREMNADFIPSLPATIPRSVYAGINLNF